MIVVQLLNVLFSVLLFILGDVLRLFDLPDRIGARVADRHPALLGELMHDLHQLPPPLFVEGGERNPDEVTVVGGGEAQIGREDRLFDRLEEALVPRLDGQELRLGRRDAGDLVERHLAAVGVHAHQIQQRRRRLSRADGGELALHRFYGFVHRVLRLFDVIRERCGGRAHWTMVPTRSPARTLAVAPGWLMLNTTMGSLFSLQRPKAFASITARSEEHTSELQSQSNLVCRLLLEKKNTELIMRCAGVLDSFTAIRSSLCSFVLSLIHS